MGLFDVNPGGVLGSGLDSLKNFVGGDAAKKFAKDAGDALNSVSAPESKKQTGDQRRLQTTYNYEYHQYPSDLNSQGSRHPYYMTFFIATQDLSKFNNPRSRGPAPLSTVDINARATRTLAHNIPHTNNIGFGRKTHRTTTAIRLYMPDTLAWNFTNQFGDVSLSGIPGMGALQALTSAPALADSMVEGYKKSGITGLLASLDSPAGRAAGGPALELAEQLTGTERGLLTSALGIAVNPQIDVIYQSPSLRNFTFEFMFSPRDAQEAAKVSKIIHLFKFHAAPEVLSVGVGRYFIPPSEFDIEFSVNTMGKISTCVLREISLDYAPSGAAFYKTDDRPVTTRMVLQFQELEFITKSLVEAGF